MSNYKPFKSKAFLNSLAHKFLFTSTLNIFFEQNSTSNYLIALHLTYLLCGALIGLLQTSPNSLKQDLPSFVPYMPPDFLSNASSPYLYFLFTKPSQYSYVYNIELISS
jgi:hypothetical protein